MKKICTKCKLEFELEEFPIINAKTGKRSSMHTQCKRDYDREYWNKVKNKKGKKKQENQNKRYNKNKIAVLEFLKKSSCENCGNSDYRVLEFNHINREEKSFEISNGLFHSLDSIFEEIKKCNVLCRNCHKIHTIEQLGYYKFEGEM